MDDLIAQVGAVDGILQTQSDADAHYFIEACDRPLTPTEPDAVKATVLAAYRRQYIVSRETLPRFQKALYGMITPEQKARIGAALAPLLA